MLESLLFYEVTIAKIQEPEEPLDLADGDATDQPAAAINSTASAASLNHTELNVHPFAHSAIKAHSG